jgi:tRNA pseudouridine38-40 synthase
MGLYDRRGRRRGDPLVDNAMSERNIKLTIEYVGTRYSGWQMQANAPSIQGEVTDAIRRVTGKEVKLIAAGRTDAGVHALGQTASFRIDHDLPAERFAPALNYHLDDDILIRSSTEVGEDFHARFDALSKRYRYLVGAEPSALWRDRRWQYSKAVDFDILQRAARTVIGEHDFAPFCVVSSLKDNNVCRIEHSRWFRWGRLLIYEIRGNRFLHNMVRSLVGAMINVATEQQDDNRLNLTLADFENIISSTENKRVVFTAPPHGLYLVSVRYDKG